MTERDALLAIRDRARTLQEAIDYARQGLAGAEEGPMDLEEPLADTSPAQPDARP